MESKLLTVAFTNTKEDGPLVSRLYREYFTSVFSQATHLMYQRLGWGDMEIVQLSKLLRSGHFPLLEDLDLSYNSFGDIGCQALAEALLSPDAPSRLRELKVNSKEISQNGIDALLPLLVRLENVILTETGITFLECKKLALAAKNAAGDSFRLCSLALDYSPFVDDKACEFLSDLVCEKLTFLSLSGCDVCDEGCRALADRACAHGKNGATCVLQTLRLDGNSITEEGVQEHLCRFLRHCPDLVSLTLPGRFKGTEPVKSLESNKLNPKCDIWFV